MFVTFSLEGRNRTFLQGRNSIFLAVQGSLQVTLYSLVWMFFYVVSQNIHLPLNVLIYYYICYLQRFDVQVSVHIIKVMFCLCYSYSVNHHIVINRNLTSAEKNHPIDFKPSLVEGSKPTKVPHKPPRKNLSTLWSVSHKEKEGGPKNSRNNSRNRRGIKESLKPGPILLPPRVSHSLSFSCMFPCRLLFDPHLFLSQPHQRAAPLCECVSEEL